MNGPRPVARLVPAALSLLALWSLVPFGVWWAGADLRYFAAAWQAWAWGSLVAALLTALLLILSRGRFALALLETWRRLASLAAPAFVGAAAALLALLAVAACLILFSGNPRNVDGFAQLFEARLLLAGRLWVTPPPELANFATLQMIVGPDRWYSQYPPGQSLVLAAGLKAGAWWLMNPLLAAALAVVTYRVARWCAGETGARLSLVVLCLSPFVVAVAGSEMSHLGAAVLGLGAAAAATLQDGRRPLGAAGLAGAALGLMTAFRPLDAVAAAAPVALITLFAARRRTPAFAVIAAAGALATLPTLWFNAGTTGSWREFGYVHLWGPQHSLGFHAVPWGLPLTPLRAVALTGLDLHQLNTYFFDAPIPILLVVAAGYLAGRGAALARDLVPLAGVAALSGLLFFYWHRDVFYGPRFLFSAAPWYAIITARALVLMRRAGPEITPGVSAGLAAVAAIAVAAAVGLVGVTPGRLLAYRRATPIFDLHPDRAAERAGISHAVVVIPDGWGSRIIARMWALGVPVRRSTRLYAASDACAIELALGDAEQDPARRARLVETLDSLAARRRPGFAFGLTDDPNLRLPRGDSLPRPCRDEIAFDRRGFLAFAPFLYLNTARLDGDIVWARDLGPRNASLFRRYAGRRFFRYAPTAPGGPPAFTPLAFP